MSRKFWNWIYVIGFFLPVLLYFGQYVSVALSDGSSPLILSDAWSLIRNNIGSLQNLCPVSQVAKTVTGVSSVTGMFTYYPFLVCWTLGADFVIWLSIIHIVLDLFMLLSRCLSKLFNKFGGAD